MILDTDVLIDILRGHPPAIAWFATLSSLPTVCGLATLELSFGVRDKAELAAVRKFLKPFPLAWPSEVDMNRALSEYAPLHLSQNLGLLDALIAATATGVGQPLATFNKKHFSGVPGLTTVQPYLR